MIPPYFGSLAGADLERAYKHKGSIPKPRPKFRDMVHVGFLYVFANVALVLGRYSLHGSFQNQGP